MAWLKRKSDPIKDKAKSLSAQIAALESEIHNLESKLQKKDLTDLHETLKAPPSTPDPVKIVPDKAQLARELVFEADGQNQLKPDIHSAHTQDHYNELGGRKFDLIAQLARIRNVFRGSVASNPKLVTYLAAGSVQGLRPLRYEKRVARNRFILLVLALLAVLFGLFWMFVH
jgi:hypothetical protein